MFFKTGYRALLQHLHNSGECQLSPGTITRVYVDTEMDSFQAMLVESCMHHVISKVIHSCRDTWSKPSKYNFFHYRPFPHYTSVHKKKDPERGWGGHLHTFLVLFSTLNLLLLYPFFFLISAIFWQLRFTTKMQFLLFYLKKV